MRIRLEGRELPDAESATWTLECTVDATSDGRLGLTGPPVIAWSAGR